MAIASNFGAIPRTIAGLKKHGASLEESTNFVEDLRHRPRELSSRLQSIHPKFEMIVKGSCGLGELCTVRDLHHGEAQGRALENTEDLLSVRVTKFAPIVSCEVERTFS